MNPSVSPVPLGANVILVDGECVYCNRVVSFILAHDRRGLFFFAHLQSKWSREVLRRYGRNADDLDSVYVLTAAGTAEERLSRDGRAGRAIWPQLFWFAAILRWVPLGVLDWGYQAFAKRRYALFGKYDACRVPTDEERRRFIDVGSPAVDHAGVSPPT